MKKIIPPVYYYGLFACLSILIAKKEAFMFLKNQVLLKGHEKENGSIIVMVLLILAIMTVIGTMSSKTTVTENFIIRNVGISKQNLSIVESAAREAHQKIFLTANNPDNDYQEAEQQLGMANAGTGTEEDGDISVWLNRLDSVDLTDWYAHLTDQELVNFNSVAPDSAENLLAVRGEEDSGNLRISLIGWERDDITLDPTEPFFTGRGILLAEYSSVDDGFGMARLEIGIRTPLPRECLD